MHVLSHRGWQHRRRHAIPRGWPRTAARRTAGRNHPAPAARRAPPDRAVYVVDDDGGLRGWVGLPELFAFGFEAAPEAGTTVETVMHNPPFLLESDNVEAAVRLFSRSSEAMLPVVSDATGRTLGGEVWQRDVMAAYRDAHEAAREG